MPVYKKDGSVYKFSSPNKLMLTQELWKNFKSYNLEKIAMFESYSSIEIDSNNVIDLTTKVRIPKKQESVEVQEIKKIINQEPPKNEITPVIQEQKISEPIMKNDKNDKKPINKEQFVKSRKVLAHCLYAKVQEKIDDLYGDYKRKVEYSETFTVEIIIIERDDFTLKFVCNCDNFTENTIVFPQDFQKRWWKITNITNKDSFYEVDCSISDIQPSFK